VVRIVVSPGGSANLIPWQAAFTAMRPNTIPFAEVELVPSLLMRRPSSPRPAVHPLVVGDPARRHEKEHLKHARAEAHEVARIYGTLAVIGTRARRGTVARLAKSSSPVHLAAHAYFDQAVPLRSGVLLSDGYLTASDLLTVGLLPGLVVISACHAGASSSVAGEERMGFPQAALLAGAEEVIVPLWEVDDETTRTIMVRLHTKLRSGASSSAALAEVLDEARRLGAERRWWAPFQLVTVLSALELSDRPTSLFKSGPLVT
jgi:CHAT domain-containing protein